MTEKEIEEMKEIEKEMERGGSRDYKKEQLLEKEQISPIIDPEGKKALMQLIKSIGIVAGCIATAITLFFKNRCILFSQRNKKMKK